MNNESLWFMNYNMAVAEEKKSYLQKAFSQINYSNPLTVCQSLEKMLCYYDLFDSEMKAHFFDYIEKMRKCSYCRKCCKDIYWWGNFRNVVLDFESMLSQKGCVRAELNQNVTAVVVPNHLSATSFLQPSVDQLMVVRNLSDKAMDYVFIDNRVEKLNAQELYIRISHCKYIVLTTTPYDHIQNYFLDYRLKYVFLLVNYFKECDPQKIVILCGAHGSIRPDIVFSECKADYVVRGEYDCIVDDIVEKLMNNQDVSSEYVLQRDKFNGDYSEKYTHNVEAFLKKNNKIPFYDCINFSNYYGDVYVNDTLKKSNKYAAILSSRGCRHNCSFCFNFFGTEVRYREPENVVDEMVYMQSKGVQGIYFMDSTFTQNREWVTEVCREIIRKGVSIPWSAETRCDRVDDDILSIMVRANCRALWFGVESYCSKVLTQNSKYADYSVGYNAIKKCRKYNIQPLQFIMIGAPGESIDSLNETIQRLGQLGESYVESAMISTPRFGTKLYDIAQKQYPYLGKDFYSLNGVRGLVSNEMEPDILEEALTRINNRDFRILV